MIYKKLIQLRLNLAKKVKGHSHKIWHIITKNFKVIFRNWSSFALLIAGPLVLMFLIGLVFSSFSIKGVTVGIVSEEAELVDFFAEKFERAFDVSKYTTESACRADLVTEATTICVLLPQNASISKGIAGFEGGITLVYDNSKAVVSQRMVSYFQEYFGITSSEIALQTVQTVLKSVGDVNKFLKESRTTLDTFATDLAKLDTSLSEYEKQLIESQVEFAQVHAQLLDIQKSLNSSDSAVSQLMLLESNLAETDKTLSQIEQNISVYNAEFKESKDSIDLTLRSLRTFRSEYYDDLPLEAKQSFDSAGIDGAISELSRIDTDEIDGEISSSLVQIKALRQDIAFYRNLSTDSTGDIVEYEKQFHIMVKRAGEFTEVLDSSIIFVGTLRSQMSASASLLADLSGAVGTASDTFDTITQADAESVIRPIFLESKPLLQSNDAVYMMFPLIIPIIIVFLSVLFSNIIMIDEIYSSAQLRNFILPLHDIYILIGFFITNFIIVSFQLGILFLFAHFSLDIPVLDNLGFILLFTFLLSSVYVLIGMIIAYASSSKENSILVSTFVTVGSFFLSDALVPLELMEPMVAFIVALNPLVIAESGFRMVLFHNAGLLVLLPKALVLLGIFGLLVAVLFIVIHRHRHSYQMH
jgi:ABC-type multidrug transport system permease subunit